MDAIMTHHLLIKTIVKPRINSELLSKAFTVIVTNGLFLAPDISNSHANAHPFLTLQRANPM